MIGSSMPAPASPATATSSSKCPRASYGKCSDQRDRKDGRRYCGEFPPARPLFPHHTSPLAPSFASSSFGMKGTAIWTRGTVYATTRATPQPMPSLASTTHWPPPAWSWRPGARSECGWGRERGCDARMLDMCGRWFVFMARHHTPPQTPCCR